VCFFCGRLVLTCSLFAALEEFLDYGGTALFAVVGAQLAGEKDMNLIGCTLVGCIAAMGGGSLNSATLLESPGVFWVRSPSYLTLTMGVSVITFYAWPLYCREIAKQKVKDAVGVQNMYQDGSVNRHTFIRACEKDPDCLSSFRAAFGKPRATAGELFLARGRCGQDGKIVVP
jgi:Glycine transporter